MTSPLAAALAEQQRIIAEMRAAWAVVLRDIQERERKQ